jgi:hypothetical protein
MPWRLSCLTAPAPDVAGHGGQYTTDVTEAATSASNDVEPAAVVPSGPGPHRRLHTALSFVPHAALLAAVLALSFLSGGYVFARATPVVLALLAVLVVWVWTAPRSLALTRIHLVAVAGLAAYAIWAGLSIVWSVGPDLTWRAFDYALLYTIVAVVAAAAPADRRHLRLVGYGFLALMAPVAVYAFLGKALPDVVTHAHFASRLSEPIGYWNALAVMLAMATPVAVEGASRRGMPVVLRGLCAGELVLLLCTAFFTFSRGGTLVLIVALGVYFALSNERLAGAISLALAAAPVALVLYHVRGLGTLFNVTLDDHLRTVQGHVLARWSLAAVLVVIVAQVVVAVVHRHLTTSLQVRRVAGAIAIVLAAVVVVTGSRAYAQRYGGYGGFAHAIAAQFGGAKDPGPGTDTASRLLSVSSNGRIDVWREAWHQYPHQRLAGTGAGTFRFTNWLYRAHPYFVVKHAHSQWVNALSELGLVGLTLTAIAFGALLVSVLRPVGRGRRGRDRGLVAALQAGVVALVLHLSVDWDWDMAAVSVAVLLIAGVGGGFGGGGAGAAAPPPHTASAPRGRFGIAARVFATGLLVLAAASWTMPYVAERAYDRSVQLASEGRLDDAAAAARRAQRFDPLAADPLLILSLIQQQQGDTHGAQASIDEAIRLQPQNYEVYLKEGQLELNAYGRKERAAAAFRHARALNPLDSDVEYYLQLSESR